MFFLLLLLLLLFLKHINLTFYFNHLRQSFMSYYILVTIQSVLPCLTSVLKITQWKKKEKQQICVNWNFDTVFWHCIISRQCVMVVKIEFWTQDVPPSSTSWMNTQHTIISIPSNLYLLFWHICFDMIQNVKDARAKTTFVSVTKVKLDRLSVHPLIVNPAVLFLCSSGQPFIILSDLICWEWTW